MLKMFSIFPSYVINHHRKFIKTYRNNIEKMSHICKIYSPSLALSKYTLSFTFPTILDLNDKK